MDEFFYYNDLFSIYKDLLTEKEQAVFSSYYEDNLSMSEIACNRNISRSAVGNTVKIVENKLCDFEKKLHIYEKNKRLYHLSLNCETMEVKEIKNELLNLLN